MSSLKNSRLRVLPLLVGFIALAATVSATLWFTVRERRDFVALRGAIEVQTDLAGVFSALQDIESSQRGYLLTGRDDYLAPYRDAVASLDGKFDRLAQSLRDRPTQAAMLADLRTVAKERLEAAKTTIGLKRSGDVAGYEAALRAGRGKGYMDTARDDIRKMRAEEHRLVDQREQVAAAASARLQMGVIAAFLLVVLLAGLSYVVNQRQLATLAAAGDELKDANSNLVKEAAVRERLGEQLRQSQKMEAVGQLTGGIAHDFNNMLAVIMGSLNLMKRRLDRGETHDLPRFMSSALDGTERAATLTHRLLAFSRQQALTPEAIDPNKFVAGMSDLLRRTLGEGVQFEIVLAGGLWRTHADPNQLDNAILNLCINARDAMPDGGKLTIETLNAYLDEAYATAHVEVPPGQYVLIAVTDTGAGMSAETIAKAFDPFFTTKSLGKGTGLGLSQVFGFVKQSGGHVKIYSEVGQGTAVKLYLPRFTGVDEPERAMPAQTNRPHGRLDETVLVVEDEDRVRFLTVESLRDLGYTVRHADGAAAALRILDANPGTKLLFTDIVMPEVNGRKLADEALRRNPELKVLYTTGYTRNAIVHNGVLDPGVHLISKPFTIDQLAAKLREVLDQV